jgi:hypothetical protein
VNRKPNGTEAREVDAPPRSEDRRRTREQTHSRLAPPLVNEGQRVAGGILRQFVDSSVIVGWSFIIIHKDILLTKYFEKKTDLQVLVPAFTAVMVFCLVSEHLQPTPSAFRGFSPPVTLRQIWTNRSTLKGNGRVFTVWYLGVVFVLHAFYLAIADPSHWSPYGTATHIWLNAAFQMSVYFVGYSLAYRKSVRLK